MKNKGLIGLLLVTLIAVAGAIFVARHGGNTKSDPLAGTKVLPEYARRVDEVARITLVRGGGKTSFVRNGDLWTVEEKGGYPADGAKLHAVVLGLADLTFVEPKTKKPALYSRLDLDDPDKPGAKSTLVTASDAKGSLLGEIIAGKRKVDELGGGNDGIYVRKPGDAQTWLARGTLDLSGDTASWLDKKLLDVAADKVKSVTLTAADGGTLAFARENEGTPFAVVPPLPADKKLKSDTALSDPAGALAGLELSDVAAAKDMPLPQTGLSTARYESFDGLVVTVTLFNKDGNDWARIEATGTGDAQKEAAALQTKFTPWVFGLPSYKAKLMETKLADVIEPQKGS
jgi:predicted Rdx family selenoprotein